MLSHEGEPACAPVYFYGCFSGP